MNWERTPEQRLEAHRYRQQQRRQNQAGRRRQSHRQARHEYGIPDQPQGPPPPGHTPLVWLLAEMRYLYRYGWPLPKGWNTTPRPRQPKLNADGDHRHVVAMRIAYNTLNRKDSPPHWIRTRISRAVGLEMAAASRACDAHRPLLLRSAAGLACDGNLPNQAELITAYALSRYPAAALLRWPSPQELAASRQRLAQEDEQLLSRALIRIAVTASGLAEHYSDTRPLAEQISALAWRMHSQHITHSRDKPSGLWAQPDHNPGITALVSWTRAVLLQNPDWPEAAELVRLTQALSNAGHTT